MGKRGSGNITSVPLVRVKAGEDVVQQKGYVLPHNRGETAELKQISDNEKEGVE